MKRNQVEKDLEPVVEEVVESSPHERIVLKEMHTHAGVQYPKGADLTSLNIGKSALQYMRNRGVI